MMLLTKTYLSEEEYLANEIQAEFKSEYHNGEVVAMAGASLAHNTLVARLLGKLFDCLEKKGCQIFMADLLLKLPTCKKYVYPDLMIVCQKPELGEKRLGVDVLLNPEIIIEVLSESTELYDRSTKFDCYKDLPSVRQYVLIDSQKVLAETYDRTPENHWLLKSEKDLEKSIYIADCELKLADLYKLVEFQSL
ncbi:MAG: Uma2 family endonuclease [Microscillaceae bacterium]|jgi:Uma2 family endonuclease|nr:Uma2 family endonuclease [Microscillaceae bacterium]